MPSMGGAAANQALYAAEQADIAAMHAANAYGGAIYGTAAEVAAVASVAPAAIPDVTTAPALALDLRRDTLTARATVGGPQLGLFGRRRVGGRIIFAGESEVDSLYYMVISLAGAVCSQIAEVYINNRRVLLDGSNVVTTPPFHLSSTAFEFYTGAQTDASPMMETAFPGWTENYVGYGQTYVVVQMDTAAAPDAYASGVPDFSFVVDGFPVYDPRDSGHDIDDAATWEFSENAALIAANYLIHPLGAALPHTLVDWASVAAAAEICDQPVQVAVAEGEPAAFEARYRASLQWSCDERHEAVLARAGAAMGGGVYLVGAQYRATAAAWTASSATYTPDDYADNGISWSDSPPISANVNGVRGVFTSPLHGYEPRDFPPYQDAAALAADDDYPSWLDLDLTSVTSASQAQRLARIAYNKTRNGYPGKLHLQFSAFDTVADDVISITDSLAGFSATTFRVAREQLQPDYTVQLEMRRDAEAFYAWNHATDETLFLAYDDVYGDAPSGGGGSTEVVTTGSASGDTGDNAEGGGALVNNGSSITFSGKIEVWPSPNISPAATYTGVLQVTYTQRVSWEYVEVEYSNFYGPIGGGTPISGTLTANVDTAQSLTRTVAAAGDIVFPDTWANGVAVGTDGGAQIGTLYDAYAYSASTSRAKRITSAVTTSYINIAVASCTMRTERNGTAGAYRSTTIAGSAISTLLAYNESTSPYYVAATTPCAPYDTATGTGTATLKTNIVPGTQVASIEFYSFTGPTETNPAAGTLIDTVANNGTDTVTVTGTSGEFAYVRARTVFANGAKSPFSNAALVLF